MAVPWESEGLDQLYFYSLIRVRQWTGEGLLVLVLEGHLGNEAADGQLAAVLFKAAGDAVRGVVLDMREVTHLTSRILPALVSLRQKIAARGGVVAVVAPSERIHRLLALLGMEKTFYITQDPEDAYRVVRKASRRMEAVEE
jgi:anti-anti-sigma factor